MPPLSTLATRIADRWRKIPRVYQDTFQTDAGVVALRDLATFCGVLETSVMAGDPQITAFNEGKRAVFLHIANHLRWNERDVLRLAESAARAKIDEETEL